MLCVLFNEGSTDWVKRELESGEAVTDSKSPLHVWGLLHPRLQRPPSNWGGGILPCGWPSPWKPQSHLLFFIPDLLSLSGLAPPLSSRPPFLPSFLPSVFSPVPLFSSFPSYQKYLLVARYVSGIFLCGIDTAVAKSEKFLPWWNCSKPLTYVGC